MFRLCALVFVLGWTAAFGVSHSVSMEIETEFQQGPLDITDLSRNFDVNRFSETVGYQMQGLVGGSVDIQALFKLSQPDYSTVMLTNRAGERVPLSDQVEQRSELSTELIVGLNRGSHAAQLGWIGTLGEAPFSSHSVEGQYLKSFYNNASVLGFRAAYLVQKQPESFYLDSNFLAQQRPETINGFELALIGEQILSENWKARLELISSQRVEERPINVGANLNQGYSLTDRIFLQLDLNYTTEMRNVVLKNERGYFRSYGGKISVTVEPIFDLLVTASYGLRIEREEDPRVDSEIQVAGDQYGLAFVYQWPAFDVSVRGAYTKTNTEIESLSIIGGLIWRI